MDLLDLAILALRIALVALLYLFLVTVMRMAARGLGQQRAPLSGLDATLKLVVVEPGGSNLRPGQQVEVSDGATLGRTPRADLVISDPAVSSEHARIRHIGGAWVVSDLHSTNGTLVNDVRVDGQTPLARGDLLTLGNVRLRVVAR